jgi:uncharacterized protein
MDRRNLLQGSAWLGAALSFGPLHALGLRRAHGQPAASAGYGPLVNKGALWLPAEFNYEIISTQGKIMSDGRPTPGIFDGMGAFPGRAGTTTLIRNHENRERAGEQKVVTGAALEYNTAAFGGNTKLRVRRERLGRDRLSGEPLYHYEVVEDFAILGGTSTNCAGGLRSPHVWITCEEVVKRLAGKKHGYIFEIDARADGPVAAIPVPRAGRMSHEAAFERAGIVYQTEDRGIGPDPVLGFIGACFYRYVPTPRGGGRALAETSGVLEALAIQGEFHANMDTGRVIGEPYPVSWVPVDEPDHEDDTDNRRDRAPGFTPTRIQAQDRGAAAFDRLEGLWCGPGDNAKVYFVCTSGGPRKLGQVWEYDPGAETLTLVYESTDRARLENPDNIVIVPSTKDVLLCEDGPAEQFVRGVTTDGRIYDFARTGANDSEFCGACFDPDGGTLYLNQQGERGTLPDGPPDGGAVTYAVYGPFQRRAGHQGA